MGSPAALSANSLKIAPLFSLCFLTVSFSTKIKTVHRQWNHDFTETERRKAQTIPEASRGFSVPVPLCQINCCPPFGGCKFKASASNMICCHGVPVFIQTGRIGGSATAGEGAGTGTKAGAGAGTGVGAGAGAAGAETGAAAAGAGAAAAGAGTVAGTGTGTKAGVGAGTGAGAGAGAGTGTGTGAGKGAGAGTGAGTGGTGTGSGENTSKPLVPTSPQSSEPDELKRFRQESLHYHNLKRAIHAAPDLILDETLNRDAQEWAEELARRKTVEHSAQALPSDNTEETVQGENIAESCQVAGKPSGPGKDTVDMWYNEVKKYDWNNPGFNVATGHFTQLVWKNSRHLGIGGARYQNGHYTCNIGVARYFPEGNVDGQFEANVLKGSYKE